MMRSVRWVRSRTRFVSGKNMKDIQGNGHRHQLPVKAPVGYIEIVAAPCLPAISMGTRTEYFRPLNKGGQGMYKLFPQDLHRSH